MPPTARKGVAAMTPKEQLKALREAFKNIPEPYCPCCLGRSACTDQCTLQEDALGVADRLDEQREWWVPMNDVLNREEK